MDFERIYLLKTRVDFRILELEDLVMAVVIISPRRRNDLGKLHSYF
jgi:hypothetical protein